MTAIILVFLAITVISFLRRPQLTQAGRPAYPHMYAVAQNQRRPGRNVERRRGERRTQADRRDLVRFEVNNDRRRSGRRATDDLWRDRAR